jgi:hypothetical protein
MVCMDLLCSLVRAVAAPGCFAVAMARLEDRPPHRAR